MNKATLILCCVLTAAVTALSVLSYNPKVATASNENSGLPLKELRLFSNIYARVKRSYVDEVEDQKLIKGAIDGMLSTLDPYSVYLKKEPYKDLKIGTTGKFGGLGIVVDMKDELVEVVSPIDDTPASRAGIETGDLIVKIDNKNVRGMKLSEAVGMMRGKIGTKVKIFIKRKEVDQLLEFELERAEIKIKSTSQTLLEPDYGYVRINRFQVRTGTDLAASVEKLIAENKRELKGLILDLRNNPGGVLAAAVNVVDYFVESQKLIVYTKGRHPESSSEFRSSRPDQSKGVPLIVLINRGSASASEIASGALQDNKRAVVMGGKSYGKGSVQTIHPLEEDTALKLTTAKYYTPSGRVIDGAGVVPDIELKLEELSQEDIEKRKKLNVARDLKEWLSYDSQVREALVKIKSQVVGNKP